MSRYDTFAVLLAILGILFSAWASFDVAEGLAQLEDEYTYQWQARLVVTGKLKILSPPEAQEFVIPFVIDHAGERFGKYPLGWPVVLAFGEFLGFSRLVNPILAGLAIWLTYRLGQKLLGSKVGLLAAGLMVISPLFLTYTGSILSHTWGLVLSLSLAISWLDLTDQKSKIPGWLPTLVAAFSLGVLALTRPWTALALAIPFGIHGLIQFLRGPVLVRKRILAVGVITLIIGSLHFLWQFVLTGDPLQNPYLLWWPYDQIGFGPGKGLDEGGHSFRQGWVHTKQSLRIFWQDLWGWGRFSWLLLLPGIWAVRRKPRVWLVVSVFPILVVMYLFYWVSGPRYFFEGLYSVTILAAAGFAWIVGWLPDHATLPPKWQPLRQGVGLFALVGLMLFATLPYAPARLREIKDRYGFTQQALDPFYNSEAQELTPALVIVHASTWGDYGVYLNLQDPQLETPFIFAWASPTGDPSAELGRSYPDRTIYHYYPDQPKNFYLQPRP
jgi:4-amino-4-deoxy-L-arabinose transferase-like glycosyltransferase